MSGVTLDPRIPGYRRNSAAREEATLNPHLGSRNTGPLSDYGTVGDCSERSLAGPGTLGHSREGSRGHGREGTGPLRGDSQRRWERRGQTGTLLLGRAGAQVSGLVLSRGTGSLEEGREGQLSDRAVHADA